MKKSIISVLLLMILVWGCAPTPIIRFPELPKTPIVEIPKELRGIWVTRFNWAHEEPDTIKHRIIRIMKQWGDANFNAVFFQVRGQAETLYPSPIEAWSKLVGTKDPGFDPVKLAIKEAHKNGLKFYAYINLLPLWNEETAPKDSNHLYFKHGPNVNPEDSWICFSEDGNPMELKGYYYMNPALPEVKTYLKEVIKHFVSIYNVDGLHFDRIRYPGPDYIYDPYSLKEFKADSSRSAVEKEEWARRKLTELVEDVVAEALLIKPYLVISAATWGLFRTDDLEGYTQFGSGYQNYYQDAIDWLNKGIMDFIVPMMYWDMEDPLPNFHDLWMDFKLRTPLYKYIFPGLKITPQWLTNGETVSQVNFVRQNNGFGTVMFLFSDINGEGKKVIQEIIYPDKVGLPDNLKRVNPWEIVSLDLKELFPQFYSNQRVTIEPSLYQKTTDSEGEIGIIFKQKPDTLVIKSDNNSVVLNTRRWNLPYKYSVMSDNSVKRTEPWVEFRRMPRDTTTNEEYHLLCKTSYPAIAKINDNSVKVYKTGIFFNKIVLDEGINRIRAEATSQDSSSAFYEREFVYKKIDKTRKPYPLWIDRNTVKPNLDQILLPEDVIRLSFEGSKGQRAVAYIEPADVEILFSRIDFADYSLYEAELPLRILEKGIKHQVEIKLETDSKEENTNNKITMDLEASIQVKELNEFPIVKTSEKNSILSYSLGEIRLGSPIIAGYDPGVHLKVSGKIGDYYRIYLNSNETGYIRINNVEELSPGTVKPGYYIQSLFIAPSEKEDIVRIPYPEPVPYAVYPEPDQNRIRISLYGVETSSTWITHRKDLKVIKKITWQQLTSDTYQIIINLHTSKIWGYEIKPDGRSLKFSIKHPPNLSKFKLDGLKIAIEAGHGGRSLGAVGLSGLLEKDINLDVAKKLEKICIKNGIDVLQVRDSDKSMFLSLKRDTVENSDADIFISIHANAAGSRGGYLRVGGTSTYYHNPFWANLANSVYRKLLELDLDEFGVVGSFNYRVTRMASRPAILVEQAFLSHAGDEEKLASDEFRYQMAQKIFDGIVEFVKYMMSN
ncbi:family 10 glycosylhydrolase [Bacteroidota bacterium]